MAEKNKKSFAVGMILVFIAFCLIGAGINFLIGDKDVDEGADDNNNVQVEKKDNNDYEDEAEKNRENSYYAGKIAYDIPEEVRNHINEIGDLDRFKVELEKYLHNELLLEDNSAVESDGMVTHNFKKKYITFDLKLNNKNRSTIIVGITEDGEYSFDYY